MSQRFSFTPPGLRLDLLNDAGNPVSARIPRRSCEVSFNQWIHAALTPSAVYCSFDPFNGTFSSTAAAVDLNLDAFGLMSKAFLFELSAEKVDESVALVDNTITVKIAGVEVGRIYIDASTATISYHHWHSETDEKGDTRFALNADGAAVLNGVIEDDNETYTRASHGMITGTRVRVTAISGGTGIAVGDILYFRRLTDNTGTFHTSHGAAQAGTGAVAITGGDVSDIDLVPNTDIHISQTTVDANLRIHIFIGGTDG